MDGNSCVFCFTHSEPAVRARKPNSLALSAGGREPNLSPGCFSASSSSRVRARKPNSLALPAGGREPNQNMGCFSASFPFQGSRSETEFIGFAGRRARTEPESGLLFRFLPFQGSRSGTEFIGFAGWQARTEKAARRGNGAYVGVVRRRSKGLRGARRQQERPRVGETAPMLAWPNGRARAWEVQGANREGCAPEKRRRGWRGPTKEQGLAGCKAPTWKAARREKGAGVGVARRRNKGLQGRRRQHGRPRAEKKAPGLAWPNGRARAWEVQGANMEGRAAGIGNRKRAAAAALFVLGSSRIFVGLKSK